MGKSIIQQARGHGSLTYRAKRSSYNIKPSYPLRLEGDFEVVSLINSAGHTAPIAKFNSGKMAFYNFAAEGMYVGKKIKINGNEDGDVSTLGNLKEGTFVFNIESKSNDGGKFVRTGGNSAMILSKTENKVKIVLPSKVEREFDANCKATVGKIAGAGRLDKPFLKAGRKFYLKRARSKLWPRTSAIKVNAVDHPFGSGRGKRPKSKIAKRNAPPGKNVGLLHPRRTGRR